jgi:hypothetical protein
MNSRSLFTTVYLENIFVEDSDSIFFNPRISLINEEDNLKIYEKINAINEKIKNSRLSENLVIKKHSHIHSNVFSKNFPFVFYLNHFLCDYDKKMIDDPLFSSYYLSLHKYSNLFVGGDESRYPSPKNRNSKIHLYDDNFKKHYELALLEFFAFVLYFCKNKSEEDDEKITDKKILDTNLVHEYINRNEKCLEIIEEKLEISLIDLDKNQNPNLSENMNCSTQSINSSLKKPLLKPFNKEEILFREECETDYGNKKITKKDIKNREDYIKKIIHTANKALIEQVEGDIIHGNTVEKQKKVVFCIPNDRNSIINKLPNI